jgi:protein tyrosine/serine phosphatase
VDSDRTLRWDACVNSRDLGGLSAGARRVRGGALVRSDSLARLTDAGRAAVLAHGIRTVIDLRGEAEAASYPNPFAADAAVTYRLVPQQDEAVWREFASVATRGEYDSAVIDRRAGAMVAMARAFAGAPEGGVVVHCVAGKDRTGLAVALLLALVGVSDDTIAEDYSLSHHALRPEYEAAIAKATSDAERDRLAFSFDARADSIGVVLAHLAARHGGAEAYLMRAGLSSADVLRIRERLLD